MTARAKSGEVIGTKVGIFGKAFAEGAGWAAGIGFVMIVLGVLK